MFVRVAAIAGAVQPALLPSLAPPVIGAAATFLALGFFFVRRPRGETTADAGLSLQNPFELATVLKFSAFVAVVMAGATVVNASVGAAGTYVVAAASGLADVDAITLSMARLAGGTIDAETATLAIALAAAVNSGVKVALAATAGTRRLALILAAATAVGLVVGGAALLACRGGRCFAAL